MSECEKRSLTIPGRAPVDLCFDKVNIILGSQSQWFLWQILILGIGKTHLIYDDFNTKLGKLQFDEVVHITEDQLSHKYFESLTSKDLPGIIIVSNFRDYGRNECTMDDGVDLDKLLEVQKRHLKQFEQLVTLGVIVILTEGDDDSMHMFNCSLNKNINIQHIDQDYIIKKEKNDE